MARAFRRWRGEHDLICDVNWYDRHLDLVGVLLSCFNAVCPKLPGAYDGTNRWQLHFPINDPGRNYAHALISQAAAATDHVLTDRLTDKRTVL
jgi:hypothetical protein